AEEAFDGRFPQRGKENVGRDAAEILAAAFERVQIGVLLVDAQLGEAAGGLELGVDRRNRGAEQFGRREGQLVALAWRTLLPRPAAIETFAGAPGAAELLVDVVRDPRFARTRPLIVGRNQARNRCLDEGRLVAVEEEVGRRLDLRGGL